MPRSRIILGDLPGIERALGDGVAGAKSGDPLAPVTVLCGHVLLKRYLPRMLARRGLAHINVRFLLPHELAAELAPDEGRARATPAADRLLVREAADAAAEYFAAVPHGDGLSATLRRLFRELELGGFGDPEALERALLRANPDGSAHKYRDLARMYGRYVERREASGLASQAEQFARADAEALEGPLVVYGVWSPPLLVASLVERIAAVSDVTVFLPESSAQVDDVHAAWRARLAAAGFAEERAADDGDGVAPSLRSLSRTLFRSGEPPFEAPEVSLVSAPDTVREAWEAARQCLEWAREGIAFHEMAVVYRNRDPYHRLVDEVFREASVPTYLHDGSLLARHPLGRRLLLLLDLAQDADFTRRRVMEFVTETRLPRATRERYKRVRPSEWEAYSREAGIVRGIEQWETRLARLASEKRDKVKDERTAWMAEHAPRVDEFARFVRDLHGAINGHPDEATWSEHLAWLRQAAAAYAEGVERIIDALAELEALSAVRPTVTFAEFCRAVKDDLETRDSTRVLDEPVREFGKQGVAIMDHTALRFLRFRAVCLVGVAERAWPPPSRPDPLLLEHERAALNAAGGGQVRLRTEPDEEALTFWLAVQAARERLCVSFARADASGSGRHVPSYYFRAIADAIEGRVMDLEQLEMGGLVTRVPTGRLACGDANESLTPSEYDRSLVRAWVERGVADATGAIASAWPYFTAAMTARRERWGGALTAYDGVLSRQEALAALAERRFAGERAVSPSRLETYAQCPYRFFLHYVLNVDPVDEPESVDRIDHLERGTLIHDVLEKFLRRCGRDDPPSAEARERHVPALLATLDEEAAERESRGVTGRPLIWRMDREQIVEDLVRWYDKEIEIADELRPGALEASFGLPLAEGEGDPWSTDAPVTIVAGGRELRFQGRIDRVDWDEAKSRFRVIDYKTGKDYNVAAYKGGEALQLPIYLLAASQMLGLPPEAGEAVYFYASSRGRFRRTTITGEELAGRRDELEQVLSTIATGVEGGYFAPHPKGGSNCRFCDYKDVCDARIDRIAERKAGDPRGAPFAAMKEVP